MSVRRIAAFSTATVFGVGLAPLAPGTAGSLVTVLIIFLVAPMSTSAWALAIGFVGALAVWSSTETEKVYGHDASRIVIDEAVGMMVAVAGAGGSAPELFLGFLLFRFFDIAKPFPVHQSQKLPRGWGVVADDLLAGIYAHAGLLLIMWMLSGVN